jgi:hypothetical protein
MRRADGQHAPRRPAITMAGRYFVRVAQELGGIGKRSLPVQKLSGVARNPGTTVILSAAKNLPCATEILRCAQNDITAKKDGQTRIVRDFPHTGKLRLPMPPVSELFRNRNYI